MKNFNEGDIGGVGCLVDSCRICASCTEDDALRLGADEAVHSKDEAVMKKHLNSYHFIIDMATLKQGQNPLA